MAARTEAGARPTGLRAALLLFGLNGALYGSWAARIPDIKFSLGLDEATLGLVLLAAACGAVSSFGLAARAADRFGAGRVTLVLAGLAIPPLPMLALAPSAWTLAATLFVFGAVAGSMDLSMNAYATEVEKRAARSRMSLLHGTWSIGFALAAAVAGVVADRLAPAPHLGMIAVVGVGVLAVAVALIVAPGAQGAGGPRAALFAIPRGPLVPVAALVAIAFLAEGAVMDWAAVHVREGLGGTTAEGARVLTAFALTMVAVRLAGDAVMDRLGPVTTARIAAGLATVGALGMAFAPTPIWAAVAMVPLALGLGPMAPLGFSQAGKKARGGSGEAVAAVALTGYGGILVGPVLMGFSGAALGLGTSFGLIALGGVAMFLLGRRLV
ncbi:MFS transporter [Pontivivens ytuae]|uniref:MFS transporter n=1 Tax=Pontivivens ytuae TaxID=2789856 RepID=A0A7S9LQS3_9RHOB|nr:MFS transporter [Pontivivens ytuae]QPH53574.1 MFS transporter [Pontivivens ytuae]